MPNSEYANNLTYDQLLFIYLTKQTELNRLHTDYIMPTVEFLIQFIPFAGEAITEWKKIKETLPEFKLSDVLDEDNDLISSSVSTQSDVGTKETNPYNQDYYSVQVGNMKMVKAPFQPDENGKMVYKDVKLDPQQLIDSVDWSLNGEQ